MWADGLSTAEVEGTLKAADDLTGLLWTSSLLSRTNPILDRLRDGRTDRESYRRNPLLPSEISFLFEIRFARALALVGAVGEYEYHAGVGDTTIDFKVQLDPPWLVELVSLHESEAFKQASWSSGMWQGYCLKTTSDDPRQSEESEILKAQERIGNKVLDKRRGLLKFPEPGGAIHMLMVDARGFLGDGHGDPADWRQIAYGPGGLESHLIKLWTNPRTSQRSAIRGLFEQECPLPAARIVRERIHVIGFVCECNYMAGEIANHAFYCCNPALFESKQDAIHTMGRWPLRRTAA